MKKRNFFQFKVNVTISTYIHVQYTHMWRYTHNPSFTPQLSCDCLPSTCKKKGEGRERVTAGGGSLPRRGGGGSFVINYRVAGSIDKV